MGKFKLTDKKIGRTEIMMSSVSLGCVTFGREIDEETSWKILDYSMEAGIKLYDTAEMYGGGNAKENRKKWMGIDDTREATTEMYSSEKILSRWMKDRGCRDEMIICTKVSAGNNDPDNIRRKVADSLERLGVDSVEVYMLHEPDENVPIAESLEALNEQVEAGRVKAIGCSNFTAEMLKESLEVSEKNGWARFEITEPPYSLADRRYEPDFLPLCLKEEISTIPYSPLAAGFLAGKYSPDKEKLPKGTRFDISPGHADIYFNDHNFRVVDQLREKAKEMDIPMVQLAMAWVMANPCVTSTLIGARKTEHIDNAISALELDLDSALREEISNWD